MAMSRPSARFRGDSFPVLTALSLVVGAFIIPVPHRQYALTFLPLIAVFAGGALDDVVQRATRRRASTVNGPVLEARRSRPGTMAAILLAISVYPFFQSLVFWERRNWTTLQNIAWVIQNVSPDETILDGFSGLGVFRRHAFFYFFLHNEIRPMLEEGDWERLATGLQNGTISPKLVLYDRHLQAVPLELRAFIETHYLPVGHDPIRARVLPSSWEEKTPRLLTAPFIAKTSTSSPYVLVEAGWHDAEQEGAMAFRRSRGKRSHLAVPVMQVDDMNAVFHARLELEDRPVVMELAVNGTAVGAQELLSGWRDYAFSVPRSLLRVGFNAFVLTYSKTPYQIDPERRGRNTVVAVQSLTLIPES